MTKKDINEFKKVAKQGMSANGIKVNMKDMTILETGEGIVFGVKAITYVMFKDEKSGREYQVNFGEYHAGTFWNVNEYEA